MTRWYALSTCDSRASLNEIMPDTLRGPILASMPFFDPRKVAALLDSLPSLDDGARAAIDQVLMMALSACVLQDRFQLAS